MTRHPRTFLGVIFLFCLSLAKTSAVLAADEVKVTTYYPAPYGEYKEMRAETVRINPAGAVLPGDRLTVNGNVQINSELRVGFRGKRPPSRILLDGDEIRSGTGAIIFNEGYLTTPVSTWIQFSRRYATKPMLFLQIGEGGLGTLDARIVGPSHSLPAWVVWRDMYNTGCQITELTPNGFRYRAVGTWSSIYWVAIGS